MSTTSREGIPQRSRRRANTPNPRKVIAFCRLSLQIDFPGLYDNLAAQTHQEPQVVRPLLNPQKGVHPPTPGRLPDAEVTESDIVIRAGDVPVHQDDPTVRAMIRTEDERKSCCMYTCLQKIRAPTRL